MEPTEERPDDAAAAVRAIEAEVLQWSRPGRTGRTTARLMALTAEKGAPQWSRPKNSRMTCLKAGLSPAGIRAAMEPTAEWSDDSTRCRRTPLRTACRNGADRRPAG
jgi:hypothetical protein